MHLVEVELHFIDDRHVVQPCSVDAKQFGLACNRQRWMARLDKQAGVRNRQWLSFF
jgi:type II secretory pathway predicted ATPase ExeA